jgi:hypothetical protein
VGGQHELEVGPPLLGDLLERELQLVGALGGQEDADGRVGVVVDTGRRGHPLAPGHDRVLGKGRAA